MSRVAGYEQRLKALFFKANFAEKVEEMKEVIRWNSSIYLPLVNPVFLI